MTYDQISPWLTPSFVIGALAILIGMYVSQKTLEQRVNTLETRGKERDADVAALAKSVAEAVQLLSRIDERTKALVDKH